MGYYLGIDQPVNLGVIGGKFFGYLEDDEFESCLSYQYLKKLDLEDVDMLNIFWSNYSFELTPPQAIIFLRLYKQDFERIEKRACFQVDEAIEAVHIMAQDENVLFIMG